jgi:hypothetical protein
LLSISQSHQPLYHSNVMQFNVCGEMGGKEETDLQLPLWLSTTTLLARRQVLPKQSMIKVSTTVKVDHRLQGDDALDILLGFGGRQLFRGGVVAVDVSLVVHLVVQLHDLAGDGGLECAVVIWHPSISNGKDIE